jgi:hypothetical protein
MFGLSCLPSKKKHENLGHKRRCKQPLCYHQTLIKVTQRPCARPADDPLLARLRCALRPTHLHKAFHRILRKKVKVMATESSERSRARVRALFGMTYCELAIRVGEFGQMKLVQLILALLQKTIERIRHPIPDCGLSEREREREGESNQTTNCKNKNDNSHQ